MRTTLVLDDDLLEKAQRFTAMTEKANLVREALKARLRPAFIGALVDA